MATRLRRNRRQRQRRPLVESTRHPDANVRLAAAAALGWLAVNDPTDSTALQALASDSDEHGRDNAEIALKRLAGP